MITIRFFAAAADAFGADQVTLDAASLAEVRNILMTEHTNDHARRVLPHCSWFVEGALYPPDGDLPLHDNTQVDVMPPFAGG